MVAKKSRRLNVAPSEMSKMRAFFSASDLGVIESLIRYTEIVALEDKKHIIFCRKYVVLSSKHFKEYGKLYK